MIKKVLFGVIAVFVLAVSCASATPQTASALQSSAKCVSKERAVFGIVPWYRGLLNGDDCSVTVPGGKNKSSANITSFVMMIALNIVQAGLTIAAYVTVFFIVKGGFEYMTSAGSSDGMTSAKKTIANAVIGLVVAVLSAAIVNAIAGVVK